MNLSKLGLATAMALAASLAQARTTDLGDGAGTFSFSGKGDSSFYIDLGPGTYTLDAQVDSHGEQLSGAWFSYSGDRKADGSNDIADFTAAGNKSFSGGVNTLTLTQDTRVYVDVDTVYGRFAGKKAGFDGSLTVSAVPEPASAALLLAGLGMMGFIARRRRG